MKRLAPIHRDERGVAVIIVVMVGLAVAAMVVLLANRSLRNSNESLAERSTDQALVLAESAANEAIFELDQDLGYSTVPGATPVFASKDDERDWVLDTIDDEGLTPVPSGDGEYAIVKPEDSDVVYTVAWIPTKDDAQTTRIVKVEVSELVLDDYVFFPDSGFAAGGDLLLGGDGVGGSKGGAHANGDLVKVNSKTEVTGCSSAEDSNDFEPDNPPECGPGTGVSKEIPDVIPRDFHQLSTHDLCIEGGLGVVREGPATSGVLDDPCQGAVITTNPMDVGWSNMGRLWTYTGPSSGVFYIDGGSVHYNGNSGPNGVTVIVAPVGDAQCPTDSGDFAVQGNDRLFPHKSARDLAVVAGRDFLQGGNSNIYGIVLAHEQIDIGGTPGVNNAVIARSACHTPGSPAEFNQLRGTASLTYNGGLSAPLYGKPKATGAIQIDRWSEL
jgi:hypothetical protein